MAKRRKTAKEPQSAAAVEVPEATKDDATASAGKVKKKKKQKKVKAKQVKPKAAVALRPEVRELLTEMADPKSRGTLSDRLNPSHPCFDKKLKANWKGFSKKERAAIVECDQKKMKASVSAVVSIEHPFDVNDDDHCETSPEAYRDVGPILHHIAALLGKAPEKLRIYDPFYCAGSVVKHLTELGFPKVYNKCEDFYVVVREGRVPTHDVLLTNPPYSGDHVEQLLRFCRSNGKPFLLLMPNYFCTKDFYEEALGGAARAKQLLYLCPRKRYFYWTPKGLRQRGKVQTQHAGAGGNRTSPFISFWFLDLTPLISAKALLRWWQESNQHTDLQLCKLADLPAACKPK